MLFCPGSMSRHVVVVRCTRTLHLINRLHYVPMDLLQIVPVTNLRGHNHARGKCQHKCENGNRLPHSCSSPSVNFVAGRRQTSVDNPQLCPMFLIMPSYAGVTDGSVNICES